MPNAKLLIARQLNDHEDSQRGVRQASFFTWNEAHIDEALDLARDFVYSLVPQEFADIKTTTLDTADCVVSFCGECDKFLGLVDIEYNGKHCIELNESDDEDEDTHDLSSFLSTTCFTASASSDDDEIDDSYTYEVLDSSNCTVKFDKELPKGTIVRYSCASPPDSTLLSNGEYQPIIIEYALAFLFLTDSESKSNLVRAQEHQKRLEWLVKTKLGIELTINTDGYVYGTPKQTSTYSRSLIS